MNEWTEQEEQQIIERAKTGDPEANYALSLWALERGEEEPDEPRWNRLAAKCLVKAAQAGYGPAQEQMASLLKQKGQAVPPARKSPPPEERASAPVRPIKRPAPDEYDGPDEAAPDGDEADDSDVKAAPPARRKTAAPVRPTSTVRRPAPRRPAPDEAEDEDGFDADEPGWDDEDEDDAPRGRGKRRGFSLPVSRQAKPARDEDGGGRWGDDKWRRLEFICVAVCAVLLVVIAVLLLTNRGGGETKNDPTIPQAGEVGGSSSGDNGGGATVSDYPDEATKSAVMAAGLDIQPAAEDYVSEPTSGTVSVSSEYLRVRKGPNTTYDPIDQLANGTAVSILAQKNDWDLISYQGESGTAYGWCNGGYVIITAGTAAGGAAAPTDDANAEG